LTVNSAIDGLDTSWSPFVEHIKKNFSSSTYLFEKQASSPIVTSHMRSELKGGYLNKDDVLNMEKYLNEFLTPLVFNHIYKMIQEWERNVFANRRGISNRLLKVGLKYFGGGKGTPQEPSTIIDPHTKKKIFRYQSPEMIMRKLGDFCMMIHDYKYAQSAYESIRREFTSDEYKKYFAGIQV
jgi:hypothetical protein